MAEDNFLIMPSIMGLFYFNRRSEEVVAVDPHLFSARCCFIFFHRHKIRSHIILFESSYFFPFKWLLISELVGIERERGI